MTFDTQWRATKEDTKNNQEALRLFLETLEQENRGLKTDERGNFFCMIADSLLGIDFDREYTMYLDDMTTLRTKNVGEFIRELAYQNTFVDSNFLKKYGRTTEDTIEIKKIWHSLKFIIFGIYPGAINVATKISQERENIDYDTSEMASFGVNKLKTVSYLGILLLVV
jgi:hypothetical protein